MEVLALKIAFESGWGNLLLCYNPKQNLTKEEFDHYFTQIPTPHFIFGDFNARHHLWNPSLPRNSLNVSGKSLFEATRNLPCSLLTPTDLVTRVDPYTGRGSTLDLCFGSDFFSMPTLVSTGPRLRSDHFPVVIDFSNNTLVSIVRRPHWNFQSAKWSEYKADVLTLLPEDLEELTIREKEDKFRSHLIEAGKKQFYLGKGKICKFRNKPWWNEECSRAVAIKRRAFNKWHRCPERLFQLEFRRLEAKAKKIILKAKRISWRKFCNEFNLHTSFTEVWRFFKNFIGTSTSHSFPLTQNGKTLISAVAKAELIAHHFFQHYMCKKIDR